MVWTLADHEADMPRENFDTICGRDEWKAMLTGCVIDPALRELLELPVPAVFLLTGAPGTGKRTLARAFAGELGGRFYSLKLSDLLWEATDMEEIRSRVQAIGRELSAVGDPVFLLLEGVDQGGGKERLAADGLAELLEDEKMRLLPLVCVMTAEKEEEVDASLRKIAVLCPLKNPDGKERAGYFERTLGRVVKHKGGYGWDAMARETAGFSFADCETTMYFTKAMLIEKGLRTYGSSAAVSEAVRSGALRLGPDVFSLAVSMADRRRQGSRYDAGMSRPGEEAADMAEKAENPKMSLNSDEGRRPEAAPGERREDPDTGKVEYSISMGDLFGADSRMNPENM